MRALREVAVHREPDDGSERVTSLTIGEEVFVVEQQGEWTRVLAPDQPTHLDPADQAAAAAPVEDPQPGDLYFFGLGAGRLPR